MSRLERAWYGGAAWLVLLRPLEAIYRIAIWLRTIAYRSGVFRSERPGVPVVVVGNLTVGGTGKTPAVIALVRALQQRGLRPAVITRGYGGNPPTLPLAIDDATPVEQSGDEAALIRRRTGVPVMVDPKRPRGCRALVDSGEIDLIVSDDGLQHYALARDFEIALIDADRALGNGWCLPAGPLREPPSRLASVDAVVTRGSTGQADLVYRPLALVNLRTGERRAPAAAALQADIVACTGIGNPAQFFRLLETLGFNPSPRVFADHHDFQPQDLVVADGRPVIMTEKDAVKCAAFANASHWFLEVEIALPEELVDRVAALVTAPENRNP